MSRKYQSFTLVLDTLEEIRQNVTRCDLEGLRNGVGEAKVCIPQTKLIIDNGTLDEAGERTREKPEANPFEI